MNLSTNARIQYADMAAATDHLPGVAGEVEDCVKSLVTDAGRVEEIQNGGNA
jgi:hypothetical protein